MEKAKTYTPEQMNDAEKLIDAIKSAPQDKRSLMTVMAEAFISGMKAQERLSATAGMTAASR